MLRVCILGYGGIARSHRKGYELLKQKGVPVELAALCDIDEKQFTNVVSINNAQDSGAQTALHTYTDLDKMLKAEKPDIVDICLPTYLHCEYAVKLLENGLNVLCEKPMGLDSEQCDKMLDAARKSKGKLMIGMCLRFDSNYLELKKMVDSGMYGKPTAAFFTRLSGMPGWGYDNWFMDYKRSGGVTLDMHIHDIDMIRFLFGEPKLCFAVKQDSETTEHTTVVSNFIYPDMIVNAVGDWGMSSTSKFQAGYRVNFEKATVIYNDHTLTVYPDEGEPFVAEYEKTNHMAGEIEYFVRCILGEIENTMNRPEDAAASVALAEKIKKSADNKGVLV